MSYCELADIITELSTDTVAQLTDDTNGASLVTATVTAAITAADDEINAYCRPQHTVPFSSTPNLIQRLSVSLSVYNLYSRRRESDNYANEELDNRYERALKTLKDIAKGVILLDDATSFQNTAGNYTSNKTSSDKVYTSTCLDTY